MCMHPGHRFALLLAALAASLVGPTAGAAEPADARAVPAAFTATSDGSGARQSVRFGRRAPQVGDQIDQQLRMEMTLKSTLHQAQQVVGHTNSSIEHRQRRLVTTAKVENGRKMAARVRYFHSRREVAAEGGEPQERVDPIAGRTYLCARQGGRLEVTDELGNIPPLAEYEIVAENMQTLGRDNPLAAFFADRTVAVGEKLDLPHEIGADLLGFSGKKGDVVEFHLTLRQVQQQAGQQQALFDAHIEAVSQDEGQMRIEVEGQLTLDVATSRAVAIDLAGPLGMAETRGPRGGQFQVSGTGRMSVAIASKYTDANL